MATKKKETVAKPLSRKKPTSKKKTERKTISKKPGASRVSSRKTTGLSVSAGTRRKMIAEEAYFLSLQRRSEGGSALEDWLAAEAQVDRKLSDQKG